ncbi:hypothetical protein QTP88_010701 [Uroleucon formosanum]
MFLLSMLPDLLKISDKEVRLFKRKSLQIVDDILSNHSAFTPIHSLSSSSTTPSTDQQMLLISRDENVYEATQPNTFQTINQNSSEKYYEAVNETLFAPLSNDDTTAIGNIENDCTPHDNSTPSDEQNNKRKLPPPIYVRGILDFVEVRNELIKLIGTDTFTCKSSINDLKIQTSDSKYYREIIHFLKDRQAQYHTYQPQEDKAFRVVVRNLHPSTPTIEVGIAIEEIGFSVRQRNHTSVKMSSSATTVKNMDTQENTALTLPDVSVAEDTILPPVAINQTTHLPNVPCVRGTIQRTTRDVTSTRTSNASASQIRTIMTPKTTSLKVVTI